jgi:hypothetical protein
VLFMSELYFEIHINLFFSLIISRYSFKSCPPNSIDPKGTRLYVPVMIGLNKPWGACLDSFLQTASMKERSKSFVFTTITSVLSR